MEKSKILSVLEENNLSDLEVLKESEDLLFLKFYFDFDKDVLAAAKSYSNEESSYKEGSSEWYKEYYIPYLYDFGNDEILSIVEDITEEFDISGEFMAFQIDESNIEYLQFMVMFTDEENEISIEELVKAHLS